VVGRVEAERGDVAERSDLPAVIGRTQGVAAVLDQPQAMIVAELADGGQVERIAQGVAAMIALVLGPMAAATLSGSKL